MDRFRISTSREANDGGGHPLTLAREYALYTSAYHVLNFETSEAEEAPLSPTGHPHVRTVRKQKADQNRRMQKQTSHQNLPICTEVFAHPSACIDFPVLMQKEKEASGCSNQAKAGHVARTDRVRKHPMISASCKPTKYTSGTKDRHSKVATAKGMRDRRVRLSPSCALNLFEIQDKLGFEQPSKAVEWLLQKAKHAIDKLPPKLITAPPNGANEQDTSSGNPTHSNMSSDHRSTSPLHELASPTSSSSHEKQTFNSLENFPPKTSDLSSSTELCHNLSLSLCPMVPSDLAPAISHVNGPHLRGIIPTPTRKDSRAKPGELRACKQNSSQLASPPRDIPHASTAISRVHVSLVL